MILFQQGLEFKLLKEFQDDLFEQLVYTEGAEALSAQSPS